MASITLPAKKLTKKQKEHIRSTILPNLDRSILEQLYLKIEYSWSMEPKWLMDRELTPAETKKELNLLAGQLQKALETLGYLEKGAWDHAIDLQYAVTNESTLLVELPQVWPYKSGAEAILLTLKLAVEDVCKSINTADGRAKPSKANQHNRFIKNLARFFQAKTDLRPSSSPETPFSNLINYLIFEVFGEPTKNAKRHIENAITQTKQNSTE
ncbi:MAG: hypothetical protein RQ899_14640 [Pseudomonadales bacterium]|nr:hypothetical protein [Pseudomonadales bacterium]